MMVKPLFVKDIRRNGELIRVNQPQVISKAIASRATIQKAKTMLESVVSKEGTASNLRFGDYSIAGKTGTTQNNSDGWFMGMVPNLVTGVWVGAEDRAVHFNRTAYGQGATMALPIWGQYMKSCYANKDLGISVDPFEEPENLTIEVDCDKWATQNGQDDGDFDDGLGDGL